MTDRTTEESIQAATQAWLRCREDRHSPPSPSEVWAAALQWQAEQQKGEADPLDMSLPCDITVGHVTMSKGVSLRSLVFRMKALYELAQEAASPHGVPPGYVLVPKEPTPEMVEAWHRGYEKGQWNADSWDSAFSVAYKAMLSSLPQAPQGEQG